MEAHQDTTVQQALQRVTGVTVNEMVPGISSYVKLNGDDRVLILVDGQSLANAQGSGYGRGSVDLASLPGIGAIDHIEVTKGSGSVRYGSGAVAVSSISSPRKGTVANRPSMPIPAPGGCTATP
jgi:outer membrane receptor for ferrienterochelin and colicin